jgi:hypothetical protein
MMYCHFRQRSLPTSPRATRSPVVLSTEERETIARSKAAASRGEFATDEQVRAVWAKHGL